MRARKIDVVIILSARAIGGSARRAIYAAVKFSAVWCA